MSSSGARQVAEVVEKQRLFAIIRTFDPGKALLAAEAAAEAGVKLVKITFTTPGALEVLEKLAGRGDILPGAGSVTTMREAVEAIDRGANFAVCPHTDRAIIDYCRDNDIYVAAGGLTPTEIMNAHLAGADLVKVFPVSSVGGPSYIQHVLRPMPFLRLVAVGGLEEQQAAACIEAGAAAVGAGFTMIPPAALERGDYEAIRDSATRFLRAVRQAAEQLPQPKEQKE